MTVVENASYADQAEAAAARALALDPNQALAVATRGQIASSVDRGKAIDLLDRAVEMAPNDAGLLMWAGDERFTAGGYLDETLPLLERAYRLDPLSGINNGVLGMAYLAAGQRELAYQHIRRGSELGWPHGTTSMVLDLLWRGNVEAAVDAQRAYWSNEESARTDEARKIAELSERVIRGQITSDELHEISRGPMGVDGTVEWEFEFYRILGDHERMFDAWLAVQSDYDYMFRSIFVPGGRKAMEHPRMIEIVNRSKLFPLWESKGYPFGCERVQDEIGDHLICSSWPE